MEDKIVDAQESDDKGDVRLDLVRRAGDALERGDVAVTKRLLEQSIGGCPDSEVLYVNDQSARPPCFAPAAALALSRSPVGGTQEVVLLIVAALLALVGVAIVRHPFVRTVRAGDDR